MFGAIAGGIASALAGGAMSKLFGGGQKAASGGIQGDVLATDNNTVGMRDPYTTLFRSRIIVNERARACVEWVRARLPEVDADRKSTRLNSSHLGISYGVFCLQKRNSR